MCVYMYMYIYSFGFIYFTVSLMNAVFFSGINLTYFLKYEIALFNSERHG